MSYGSPSSKAFVEQLADKNVRDVFVADQIRSRIALMIRALREQPDRNWTQAELGERAGKPQNVISRLEDPDYGRITLQSLFDVSAAFDVPVWIDMPDWSEWLSKINNVPNSAFARESFDMEALFAPIAPEVEALTPGSAAANAFRSMLLDQPSMNFGSATMNANQAQASVNQTNLQRAQTTTTSSTQGRDGAYELISSTIRSAAA